MSEYEDKNITHCPLCGEEFEEVDSRGMSNEYICSTHGDMRMEVWGYVPDFWHRT